jgi:hypothetical protein
MDDWKKGASLNLLNQARDGMMTGFVWKDHLSEMVNELTAERVVEKLS